MKLLCAIYVIIEGLRLALAWAEDAEVFVRTKASRTGDEVLQALDAASGLAEDAEVCGRELAESFGRRPADTDLVEAAGAFGPREAGPAEETRGFGPSATSAEALVVALPATLADGRPVGGRTPGRPRAHAGDSRARLNALARARAPAGASEAAGPSGSTLTAAAPPSRPREEASLRRG